MADKQHPWITGAAEMDRMYGDIAETRRAWMTAAIVSMGCSVVLAAGLVYVTVSYDSAPYLVEVDALGEARLVNEFAAQEVPVRVQQATLRRVLVNMRQVPTDIRILRAQHDIVRAHLSGNAAQTFAEDLSRDTEALADMVAKGQRRYVQAVRSVLPFPRQPGLFRVSWTEETLGGRGETEAYEGHFHVVVAAVEDPAILVDNPMGVFITDYSIGLLAETE